MFENSTVNLSELCNSCAKIARCSSELNCTFLYVGNSIQNASEQFVSCIHVSLENFALHRQTPNEVRSGDSNISISVSIRR
jgi:ketopantoate hydroxymethyltransferase